MSCDIPFERLPERVHLRFLVQLRRRVNAEFPKLYVRPRMIEHGESDEVSVVTPAALVAPGASAPVMSMGDVAEHIRIKNRVTAIRDELVARLRDS